jgi:hypothetical protein
MEPLWSPVVATSGNHWQIAAAETGENKAETAAVGCNQLRPGLDGKEGVSGSSPEEGSKDVIPICLTAVSSGDDDAAAAGEVFRCRLQEERGHARA